MFRTRTEAFRDRIVHACSMKSRHGQPFVTRLVFGFIALNAGFGAVVALSNPRAFDKAFTWAVLPPLDARFVGALYLWGTVLLVGALRSHDPKMWWPATIAVATFTTSLGVLTALNSNAFDVRLTGVKVWILCYSAFPVSTLAVAWRYRRSRNATALGADGRWPASERSRALQGLAGLFLAVGLGLLFGRDVMVGVWPWDVSKGVAQFYGGPFVTLAWCSWAYSRSAPSDRRPFALSMTMFGLVILAVSLRHRDQFDFSRPSTTVWFGGFAAVTMFFMDRLKNRDSSGRHESMSRDVPT